MNLASSAVRPGKLERAYCLFIFLCVVAYNVYLDSGWVDPEGNAFDFLGWWLVFLAAYLISVAVVSVRVVKRFVSGGEIRTVMCHAIYVVLFTVVVVFQWETDYAKRYIQSLYYARDAAECRSAAQSTQGIAICYSYASHPRMQLIVIDPNHELSLPMDRWRVSTIRYFSDRKYPAKAIVDCRPPIVDHFYGDVFYLKTFCE